MSSKNLLPRGWVGVWVGAAILGTSGTSVAAGNPKVLVLPYQHMNQGMPDDLGEQTTVVVARELSAQGLNVIRADDVGPAQAAAPKVESNPDAPTGDPKAQATAEKYVERAREAMDDGDFGKATKMLERASKLLEENGDAVPDLRMLAEIYLQAGVAFFRDGMEDEGDDMLNRAVHLDPERSLDGADYPPIFIKVFDRARYNVLRRPRGRVEVKAQPGASVLFDGRNLGKAPLVLTDVLPGEHWVRVERPGEAVQVKKVRVGGGKTLEVEFAGASAEAPAPEASAGVLGAIASNKVAPEDADALAKAGKKAGADFVMFGGIYKTDTAYQIRTAYVAVTTGKVGRITDIAFDLDMLSAEIEVFKLVDDAKNQAQAGALARPEDESPFVLAPKLRAPRAGRTIARPGEPETKLSTVAAAPPPIQQPESVYAEGAGTEPAAGGVVATAGGDGGRRPATKAPSLVPKDEVGSAPVSEGAPPPPLTSVGAVIPKDEKTDDDEGSLWWVWVIAGVAVAGAATAGGILLANGGSSDQGSLTISW
jgi:hypothetical protein